MLVTVPLQEKSVSQSQHPTSGTWPVTSDTDTIDTDSHCLCSRSDDVGRISAISYTYSYTIGLTDNDIIKDPLVVTITELGSMCRGLLLPYTVSFPTFS